MSKPEGASAKGAQGGNPPGAPTPAEGFISEPFPGNWKADRVPGLIGPLVPRRRPVINPMPQISEELTHGVSFDGDPASQPGAEEAPDSAGGQRRGGRHCLDFEEYEQVKDALYSRFGLADYVGCLTGEMASRPVPQVFPLSTIQSLTDAFGVVAEEYYTWLLPKCRVSPHTFMEASRLGHPYHRLPIPEWGENKKTLVMRSAADLEKLAVDECFNGAFATINVRLQPEKPAKEREFQFIDDTGQVHNLKVGGDLRAVQNPIGQVRTGSRTRLVFCVPSQNNVAQPVDNFIHKGQLRTPLCGNVPAKKGRHRPVKKYARGYDVRHMERYTPAIVRLSADILGGLYADISRATDDAPFLCPSVTWRTAWLVRANRAAGFSEQFASGRPPVARAQKDLFLGLLLPTFAMEAGFASTYIAALEWAAAGGDDRLSVMDYGDDLFASSDDERLLDELFEFLSQRLTVEIEPKPKFLGMVWSHERQRFELDPDSYLLKTYNPERSATPPFRRFAWYGWRARREIYAEQGPPEMQAIFRAEDALLAEAGLQWSQVEQFAEYERLRIAQLPSLYRDARVVTDNEWKLSEEEKAASGLYSYVDAATVQKMIPWLIDKRWHRYLNLELS